MPFKDQPKIAIIGLGYVGLPLAAEFGKQLPCVGFDINQRRVKELQQGLDNTLELSTEELSQATHLQYSWQTEDIADCDIYIITVPTPIDDSKQPDLSPLISASKLVGAVIQQNNIVIYESTVYPGCTEEACIPVIEATSGLTFNQHFFAGYSPERINPGDKNHRVTNIIKVTSGSTPETANYVDQLYQRIVTVGTHKASSIKVAEASKVIENTQRDVNIALINELALIFNRLHINTEDVLEAAGTKWNFLPFRPGLVGGHCIGVDPYYLVHKAEQAGYHPQIISASRRINDRMGHLVATEVMRLMTQKRIHIVDANVLILGLAFKENCPDLRNTRVMDIVNELKSCNAKVHIHDPWVSAEEAKQVFDVDLVETPQTDFYDTIILAVAHDEFKQMGIENIRQLAKSESIIFDIKYAFPSDAVDGRL
ncbi:Vi polysaccharide biosynthesis UDP-N-acetylglucosamine C-6 dehydrogenase TviB [Oceanicoccus sp. KOV_DT_Chl]|uniref:Vi polysaccharide biosynthesis UDP-N-acetylglucosamine C-6 dehydrogenase TviB n=1 Tax=Oceanicoccus sp. KOV_DT_Chl TaxID=1904639 RepID=UPI000C7E6D12|nr:Vi polysaccharide biosynthesis UDP-N-acetylglucosamine C-6 dehydrogenase TviB [Oceanicoccus sp. KOV_DT_Chl]